MTEYIKPKEIFDYNKEVSEVVVQPLTLRGVEKFSLWSVAEKKFYREGETVVVDGEEKTVDKYIKLTDEQKKLWGRNFKISREVIYDGKEYVYDMPKTLNDALENTMETIQSLGQNPLSKQYVFVRQKTGPRVVDIEYKVRVGNTNSVTTEEPELSLEEEPSEPIELSDIEQKYVSAIIKKYPDYNTEKYKDGVWAELLVKKLSISPDRANDIEKLFLR